MFTGYATLVVIFYSFAFVALLVSAWKRRLGLTVASLGGLAIASLYAMSVLTEGAMPSGQLARIVGVIALLMIVVGLILALFGGRKKRPAPASQPTP